MPMDTPFSLKELAKLIKICKNDGVSCLEYGNVKISMSSPEKQLMTPAPLARASAKKVSKISESAELQSQYDESRVALETLHVEDPVAYEALLIQGALDEEKNH